MSIVYGAWSGPEILIVLTLLGLHTPVTLIVELQHHEVPIWQLILEVIAHIECIFMLAFCLNTQMDDPLNN